MHKISICAQRYVFMPNTLIFYADRQDERMLCRAPDTAEFIIKVNRSSYALG